MMLGRLIAACAALMITAVGGAAEGSAPRAPAGLCRAPERQVFSCRAGARIVSVCAGGGKASYRSSRNGVTEIDLSGGRMAMTGYSGGGEEQVVFTNGDHRYVVYVSTTRGVVRGRAVPVMDGGVMVLRGDRQISRIHCDDAETVVFERLEEAGLPETETVEY